MKIHVLYDRSGKILAAVDLDAENALDRKSVGRLRPVPQKGQQSADVDVPREYAGLGFVGACRALAVDPKRRTLVARKIARKGSEKASRRSTTR